MFHYLKRSIIVTFTLIAMLCMLPVCAVASESTVDKIQSRIDAVLTQYGVTAEMSDKEIADAITAADGNTIQATMNEIAAIDETAQSLTEAELTEIDSALYGRFCDVLERLYNPVPLTTVTVLDGQVSVTDTANSNTVSNGTVTIKASGTIISKKTNTITITNESDSKSELKFSYSASTYNSFTVAGVSASASGTYSGMLESGGSVTLVLVSNSGLSNRTATLTLSNFSLVAAAPESNVTVEFDSSLGSVTVAGTAASSGSVHTIDSANGATIAASPANFVGWIDTSTKEIISIDASFTYTPTKDTTIKAIHGPTARFFVGSYAPGGYLFESLADATTFASSLSNKTVVLANNGTLAAGDYLIPSGVTFVVPFDAAGTTRINDDNLYVPVMHNDTYTTPTVFRRLTLASGAHITVEGNMVVAGSQSSKYAYNGYPSGPLGFVTLNGNSFITVASVKDTSGNVTGGGKLYVWGYIQRASASSEGTVTVENGAAVYECFQVSDYRGGNITSTMTDSSGDNITTWRVLPLNQYYVQNVEVPMTLKKGSREDAHFAVSVTWVGTQTAMVPFIGAVGMFNIGENASVTKDYDEETDRMIVDVDLNGEATIQAYSFSIKVESQGSITVDTNDYVLPITNNLTINVRAGSKLNIAQDIALLPGAEINIDYNATSTLKDGSLFIVYDKDNWDGYCGASNQTIVPLSYVPGKVPGVSRTFAKLGDGVLNINGTADATNGYAYSTVAGGGIISSEGTGIAKIGSIGALTTTYQVKQYAKDQLIGTERWIEEAAIPITPAKLLNSNSTYTETTGASSTTYKYINGFWHSGGACTGGTATCSKKAVCTICGKEYGELLSHTEVTDAAVDATCTTPGKTEGKHCSVCGEVIVAQEEVAALGHTEVVDAAVAATCTTPGKTEGKHCSVCNAVIVPQEDIPTLSHSYTSVVTKPTCTTAGYTTHTCSACGDSYTDAEVPANGHNWGDWSTGACSVCGEKAVRYDAINLSIEGEILLNLKYYIHEDAINAGIQVTVTEEANSIVPEGNTWTKAIDKDFKDKDGVRYVISQGIAAGEMTGDVTVAFKMEDATVPIFDNDDLTAEPVTSMTRTVLDFAQAATDNLSERNIALCKGALTFGGYAQLFYGTHKNKLAFEFLNTDNVENFTPSLDGADALLDTVSPTTRKGENGVTATTQKLNLDSKIYIRTYFTLPDDKKASDYTFTISGPDNNGSGTLTKDGENNRYYVDIVNVPPAYWDDTYIITITDTTMAETEDRTYTVTTNVLAWCARCVTSSSASEVQKNMARAMYFYNEVADKYFNEKNAQ